MASHCNKGSLRRELSSECETEGELVYNSVISYLRMHASSFHHFVVPLPLGGRLMGAV